MVCGQSVFSPLAEFLQFTICPFYACRIVSYGHHSEPQVEKNLNILSNFFAQILAICCICADGVISESDNFSFLPISFSNYDIDIGSLYDDYLLMVNNHFESISFIFHFMFNPKHQKQCIDLHFFLSNPCFDCKSKTLKFIHQIGYH